MPWRSIGYRRKPCEATERLKVTINRPDKLNALNQDVTSSIKEMCKWVEENDSIRCVVITGAKPNPPPEGKRAKPHAFVAGADITIRWKGLRRD